MNSVSLITKINTFKLNRQALRVQKSNLLTNAQVVGQFTLMPKTMSRVNLLGNIAAASAFFDGALALSMDFKAAGSMLLGFGALFRHMSIKTHKEAIKQAAQASEKLIEKGFSQEEIKFATNKILSRNGNLVYSNLFKILYPKRMEKIAQGIEPRSGFLHLPFDKMTMVGKK